MTHTRIHGFLTRTILLAGLYSGAVNAVPAIWEAQLGATVTDTTLIPAEPALDREDNATISLVFGTMAFPFTDPSAGPAAIRTYTGADVLNISSNGFISLGGNNGDGCILTDCEGDAAALIGGTFARIAPFWTDLDPDQGGDVFINRFNDDDDADIDRIVITFATGHSDCNNSDCTILAQVQLLEDGTIIFGYNGVDLVNPGDTVDDDLLIGVSPGGGVIDPGSTDLSTIPPPIDTLLVTTVYELFPAASAPPFDLDDSNIIFTPNGTGGFVVSDTMAIPPVSTQPQEWETRIGTTVDGQALDNRDDATTGITLNFGTMSFPFAGTLYTGVNLLNIASNGFISLGGSNGDGCNGFSCQGDAQELIASIFPRIAPFWTDLNPGFEGGDVFINRFDEDIDPTDIDRIVITFATGYHDCDANECHVLVQVQLLDNGTIIFGYNGIDLRNAANDANDDVLVGISPAGGGITDPGSTDITTRAPFHSAEPTIYELFESASAPPVDLDGGNVIFTPDGNGGFDVTAPGISGTSIDNLGGGGGGGGCSSPAGKGAAFDPTLWLLVLVSCIYLGYRRPCSA